MNENPKLIKVTLEFEDHTRWLEGADAQEWYEAANSQCVMGAIHGNEFPSLSWRIKRTKKIKDANR